MKRLTAGATLSALCFVLAGCAANYHSIKHEFKPNDGDSISIDAKQRVVYTVQKDYTDQQKWKAICAEPSPDALSAISASAAVDAAVLNKALGIAFGSQEGAASIGLRTQTITILRDAMYRLCEGYASGALDDVGYARLQRRYQNIMLGLLSIEQLTGAVTANQAVIQGNVASKLGQSLSQVTTLIGETRERAIKAEADLDAAKTKKAIAETDENDAQTVYDKALKDAGNDETKDPVKAAKTVLDDKVKAATDAKKAFEAATATHKKEKGELADLVEMRKNIDAAAATAATVARLSSPSRAQLTLDAATIGKVADSVQTIVTTLVKHDYTKETCLDTVLSRQVRNVNKMNADAVELQLKYCMYALQAGSQKAGEVRAAGTESPEVAALKAFKAAVESTTDRARARSDDTKSDAPDGRQPPKDPAQAPAPNR